MKKELILIESCQCNLNCSYCEINNSIEDDINIVKNNEIRMALKDNIYINNIKTYFNENKINPQNIFKISLWGGEPTINLDIFYNFFEELIIFFPNIQYFQITSNFINITNLISFLSQVNNNKIFNKNFIIQVSYDGKNQTKINRNTDFSIIYNNLLLFNQNKIFWKNLNVCLKINSVLSESFIYENIENFYKEYIQLINQFQIDEIYLNIQHPLILSKENSKQFSLQILKLQKIIKNSKIKITFLEALKKVKKENINENIINIFYKKNNKKYFRHCGIGEQKITLLYTGKNIYCHDAIFGENLNTKNDLRKNQQNTDFFQNTAIFNYNFDYEILTNTIKIMDLLLENKLINESYNNKEKLMKHAYLLNSIQFCKEDNIITTGSIYGIDINYIILMCNGLLDIEV